MCSFPHLLQEIEGSRYRVGAVDVTIEDARAEGSAREGSVGVRGTIEVFAMFAERVLVCVGSVVLREVTGAGPLRGELMAALLVDGLSLVTPKPALLGEFGFDEE